MTKQLYYENAYQTECKAKVLVCNQEKNGYEIVLDQTVFYPEGGGQPGDTGFLNQICVLDTIEKNKEIIHLTEVPFTVGEEVKAVIDWEKRLHYSTRHSGEHIFSGVIHSMLGYDNAGFHMGEDYVTVDFNGLVSKEEADSAEQKTNEIILQNKKIEILYPQKEEADKLDFRSKKEIKENLRIVKIADADVCACCGTHVAFTGEIGMVKVIAIEGCRGGSRLTLKIGRDAYIDYCNKHEQAKMISKLLSVKTEEIRDAAGKLLMQNNELKQALMQQKEQHFEERIRQFSQGTKNAIFWEDNLNANEIRKLCDKLMKKAELAVVLSGSEEKGYLFVMGSLTVDVMSLGKRITEELGGRGGGKDNMFQGKTEANKRQIEDFLS